MLFVLCRRSSLQSELEQLKKEMDSQVQSSKHEVSALYVCSCKALSVCVCSCVCVYVRACVSVCMCVFVCILTNL